VQREIPPSAPDDSGSKPGSEEDAESHFNLGMAFWEMRLLDRAIGEFQEAVNSSEKTLQPANHLQACSLLASCFMEKDMAPIAVKWYCRALQAPRLDREARLALQYDLGVAYERVGDLPRALEMFSEVYGQKIDFRDVAEKIRALQRKAS
jgi:tetratricopeptide (TPR) repeat protein